MSLGCQACDKDLRPAPDRSVYVRSSSGVVALDASGRTRWEVRRDAMIGNARLVVGPGGTVYFPLEGGTAGWLLQARRPDGQLRWQRAFSGDEEAGVTAVTGDGTLLLWEGGRLRAFAPDGTERWTHATEPASGIAVGADGTAYLVATRVRNLKSGRVPRAGVLRAIGIDGRVRWTYRGFIFGAPVVGGDGTIYVGGASLVALRPSGSRAWSFKPGRPLVPKAIGPDGTLYIDAPYGGSFTWATFALARPTVRGIRLPDPSRARSLISRFHLSSSRFRMRGAVSLCPGNGRWCRPATPLGSTLSFTLKRESIVSVVVRRADTGTVVSRLVRRTGVGTHWRSVFDVTGYRELAPGRYTMSAQAVRGASRVTAGPLRFTIVS
jgi:hypothetical protein